MRLRTFEAALYKSAHYITFPDLGKHPQGLRFSTDDELKYATEEWLKEQSEVFYFTGIKKVQDRY